jgi:uncharacterized protein YbjT (DUF2867 family)
MERILITGASGKVGKAILQHFTPTQEQELYLATRSKNPSASHQLYFDLEDTEGSAKSLEKVDTLFLLRPPQISDVQTYFSPLIFTAQQKGIKHIVFLSVQGAEKRPFIPHARIEKLITKSSIAYTFIRPSYFMQNLTDALLEDIRERDQIFLPAGQAKFLWIDVSDVGKAIAAVLNQTQAHAGKAYTITGRELLSFGQVAAMLSDALGRKIRYISPNPIRFFFSKKKQGMKTSFILVLIMLHYLPRFQSPPPVSEDLNSLTGDRPTTLKEFIDTHLEQWQ